MPSPTDPSASHRPAARTVARATRRPAPGPGDALPRAPWPEDLSPEAVAELELPLLDAVAPGPVDVVDVVVVGGGVAGLSAAIGARVAGARVLLLEADAALGQGATGRNAGILSAGINAPLASLPADGPLARMWPATTTALLGLIHEAAWPGALLRATLTGAFVLAQSATAARHLARDVRAREALGLRAEMWEPARVAEATAGRLNTRTVVAAEWLPDEGRLQPLTLLAHLARRARAVGITLAGGACVDAWDEERADGGPHRWRLRLADGTELAARGLVLAVGPTAQPTARIYALALRADLPATFPLFWDAAPYTYYDFRPGEGRLGVSGGRYARAGAARRDAHYHAALADAVRHWLPELAGERPTHAWAVDLAVAPDMVPAIRLLGGAAPGAAVEGLGALGVLPGLLLGREAGARVARAIG